MKRILLLQRLPHWRFLFAVALFAVITLIANNSSWATQDYATFHSTEEYAYFNLLADSLPRGYNGLFAGSGECVQCHGFDTAMLASVDVFGNDINLVDDWKATMMANSAKDPFWRAKVSHEVMVNPDLQQGIETKCTSCHAPLGHFAAMHAGAQYYSMAELLIDSIALDGVSCLACHQQSEEELGSLHSGHVNFDTAKVAYGPFTSPLSSPMLNATDYEPLYSPHISDAGICASCHTLITETVDLDGNYTGQTFVEQATYHEWLNSAYAEGELEASCQSCHMPVMQKGMFQIIAGFPDIPPRDRFYLHELVGGNVNMLKIMRDHADELNISATGADFDAVIAATEDMLQNRTLNLNLTVLERTADTVFASLELQNLAGHKFPSGYPARRAFISCVIETMDGDTLFHSGAWNDNYELTGHDPEFEPHYNTIRDEAQVQIYEQVLGDVNNDKTTVLLRAATALKDNRLPPSGFRTTHSVYDTTRIYGNALLDDNFNRDEFGEGTGRDIVFYHLPTQGYLDELRVRTTVYYQSIPPRWMAEIFAESSPAIDRFREMYEAAERTPVQIASRQIVASGIVNANEPTPELPVDIRVWADGRIQIDSPVAGELKIFSLLGQPLLTQTIAAGTHTISNQWPSQVVVVHLASKAGQYSEKIWLP